MTAGGGNDTISFNHGAAYGSGSGYSAVVNVDAGDGNNQISFGNNVARSSGYLNITAGLGDDVVSFGESAAGEDGYIGLSVGAGDDTITFGVNAVRDGGSADINVGAGADSITFGEGAVGKYGDLDINLGSDTDVDVVTFEGTAASGSQSGDIVVTGAGVGDQIVFEVAVTAQGLGSTTVTLTTNNKVVQISGTAPIYGNVNGAGTMFTMTAGVP